MTIRNRIVRHVRVRTGNLVPHELNPRIHRDAQREALAASMEEVGFAPRFWLTNCPTVGSSSSTVICAPTCIPTWKWTSKSST